MLSYNGIFVILIGTFLAQKLLSKWFWIGLIVGQSFLLTALLILESIWFFTSQIGFSGLNVNSNTLMQNIKARIDYYGPICLSYPQDDHSIRENRSVSTFYPRACSTLPVCVDGSYFPKSGLAGWAFCWLNSKKTILCAESGAQHCRRS